VLLDEDNFLNEKAEIADIRAYIWYTETGENYQSENHPETETNPYLLGEYFERSYYFHYEKEEITHLDYEFLATIQHQSESYLIYADVCYLSDEFLEKHRITFKKIPRDISRL